MANRDRPVPAVADLAEVEAYMSKQALALASQQGTSEPELVVPDSIAEEEVSLIELLLKTDAMIEAGRVDDAMELLEDAMKLDPDSADSRVLLCEVYLAKQNYPLALGVADERIEKNPDDAYAYYQRAFARSGMEEYREAIDDMTVFIGRIQDPEFYAHAMEVRKQWMGVMGQVD